MAPLRIERFIWKSIMDTRERPLSPHLQVYKPQLTSILSIMHRVTGVALAVGTCLLVWWLVVIALGGEYYTIMQNIMGSWYGRLALLGWSFALFYHLCNGIRHLFWDMGVGLELRRAYQSGWLVIGAAILLTLGAWTYAYQSVGAL
jgi:succinate dehydrogenase / fumarate reductase cytochrome b subunit